MLASGSTDGNVFLWDREGGGLGRALATSVESANNVHFSRDGSWLLANGRPDNASLSTSQGIAWKVPAADPVPAPTWRTGYLHDMVRSPDGTTIIAEETAEGIVIADIKRGEQLDLIPVHTGGLGYLKFSHDGRAMVIVTPAGGVQVWESDKPGETRTVAGQYRMGFSRAYFDDSASIIAAYGGDKDAGADRVFIWDTKTGTEVNKLETGGQHIVDLAFSPDGRTLAGISLSGKVLIWSLSEVKPQAILTGHTTSAGSVAFNSDGSLLASSSGNEAILWDAARRVEIGTVDAQASSAGMLSFSPVTNTLAIGGRSPILLDVDEISWRSRLCDIAGRNLTPDEWATYVPDREYESVCPGS